MRRQVTAGLLTAALLLTGCSSGSSDSDRPGADRPPAPPAVPTQAADRDLSAAESVPVEDSYYPRAGDPGVDTLHYGLDLTWDRRRKHLTGVAEVTVRATRDAQQLRLDLGDPLEVESVAVDDEDVAFEHPGKNLVVASPVRADREYLVRIRYAGRPAPVRAPTTRQDFSTTGFTVTKTGEAWTMQEPFGAFTWYPVNDQPSDKAFYDFILRVDDPWVGVANGTMTSREEVDGQTVTSFHLAEPAASYLTTVAFGEYEHEEDETASGIPLNYWVPTSMPGAMERARRTRPALEWAEGKLGEYPFSSAGTLVVPSQSGMETQTLLTLGNTPYTLSDEVLVHELVHQWMGDLVTPEDWRDVWMNEGITMYLQWVYRDETGGGSLADAIGEARALDQQLRDEAGPPGAYDPGSFGSSNIYYSPAVMWHELRQQVGDRAFWSLVRKWPQQHAYGNADREDLISFVERETGAELSVFFDRWLLGRRTPPRS